jgi:hypothetical protein
MKALVRTTMAAALLAAGYYGREWQDVIDRSMADPIGPYEITFYSNCAMKTNRRTGRIWVASKETNYQWLEMYGPKSVLAKKG